MSKGTPHPESQVCYFCSKPGECSEVFVTKLTRAHVRDPEQQPARAREILLWCGCDEGYNAQTLTHKLDSSLEKYSLFNTQPEAFRLGVDYGRMLQILSVRNALNSKTKIDLQWINSELNRIDK